MRQELVSAQGRLIELVTGLYNRVSADDYVAALFLSPSEVDSEVASSADNASACLQTGYAGTKFAAGCKQAQRQLMYRVDKK